MCAGINRSEEFLGVFDTLSNDFRPHIHAEIYDGSHQAIKSRPSGKSSDQTTVELDDVRPEV